MEDEMQTPQGEGNQHQAVHTLVTNTIWIILQTYVHVLLQYHMQGLLPGLIDDQTCQNILDMLCGAGRWVLDLAHSDPGLQVEGIESNKGLYQYALAGRTVQRRQNAHFIYGSPAHIRTRRGHFYDLVHLRFTSLRCQEEELSAMLREGLRIGKGQICWIEAGELETPHSACTRWYSLLRTLLQREGHHLCTGAQMVRHLHEAGWRDVQHQASIIDLSAGTPGYHLFARDWHWMALYLAPLAQHWNLATREELAQWHRDLTIELLSPQFQARWTLHTVIGRVSLKRDISGT
ncbi:hypothetical protein KSB_28470 [Ktedonobacter robiniae]|uniref:Methyltransferase domain-containing protein n=2 Tax=Ktedonobacter robiniae TaxID=2778365 RepID=A0ABQ3UPT5_9CHLR|nr:hypothetical protein KSB_28470 [Ktedonobacter robiniae]